MKIENLLSDFEKWLRDDQDRGDLTVRPYLIDIKTSRPGSGKHTAAIRM